jgi:hypothetical protein
METTITGKTLLARLRFLEERLSPADSARVFDKLSPADQGILRGIILPVARYPLKLNARLDTAIADVIEPTNPKRAYRALGRSSAELNFEKYHSILIAPNDPHFIMSRIGAMRRLYYEDGDFAYERVSDTSARIFVRGMATVTTPDCESTAGFYEVAIARSGGLDVDVRHRCRLSGATECTFDCGWRMHMEKAI